MVYDTTKARSIGVDPSQRRLADMEDEYKWGGRMLDTDAEYRRWMWTLNTEHGHWIQMLDTDTAEHLIPKVSICGIGMLITEYQPRMQTLDIETKKLNADVAVDNCCWMQTLDTDTE